LTATPTYMLNPYLIEQAAENAVQALLTPG